MIFDKLFKKDKDSGKSIETKPVSTVDYYAEGKTQFDAGHYTQAIEYFQAAIAEHPSNESAFLKLSETYIKMGKEELAKKSLFSLLAINPSHKGALSQLHYLLEPPSHSNENAVTNSLGQNSPIPNTQNNISPTNVRQSAQSTLNTINDPIVGAFHPSHNGTPYWMIEQSSGNRFYVRKIGRAHV